MDIIVSSYNNIIVYIPLNLIFWVNVCTYVIHIFEESVLPEVFVDKVRRLYFTNYNWSRFFGFNTFLLTLNIIAVIIYESVQGAWLIFPLALMIERFFNGIYHLMETIITKKYSSGLLTSVIVWIISYILIRYSFLKGVISNYDFVISLIIGLAISILIIVPLITGQYNKLFPLFKKRTTR